MEEPNPGDESRSGCDTNVYVRFPQVFRTLSPLLKRCIDALPPTENWGVVLNDDGVRAALREINSLLVESKHATISVLVFGHKQ